MICRYNEVHIQSLLTWGTQNYNVILVHTLGMTKIKIIDKTKYLTECESVETVIDMGL